MTDPNNNPTHFFYFHPLYANMFNGVMAVCDWCGCNTIKRLDVGFWFGGDDKVCRDCYLESGLNEKKRKVAD